MRGTLGSRQTAPRQPSLSEFERSQRRGRVKTYSAADPCIIDYIDSTLPALKFRDLGLIRSDRIGEIRLGHSNRDSLLNQPPNDLPIVGPKLIARTHCPPPQEMDSDRSNWHNRANRPIGRTLRRGQR